MWTAGHVPEAADVDAAVREQVAAAAARRDRDDGWLAVFLEFWTHVLRHPEHRARFAELHGRAMEPFVAALDRLAAERGPVPGLDSRELATALMGVSTALGLERLTRPDVVGPELAVKVNELFSDALGRPREAPPQEETEMDPRYEASRLIDVARSMKLAARSAERERWPREQLARFQQERLEALAAHARAHSPYYRERIGGGPVELAALPVLDKTALMERFDDIVTDRRLRRDELLAHLERIKGDELLHGRYRAMTTSGSSGRKGLYVYDRPGWVAIGASFMRFSAWAGTRPKLPRRRMAMVAGGSPTHMSRRGSAMLSVGMHRMLALPVTTPVPRMVEALDAFGPDCLHAYPSMAVLLADEKRAGRLRAAPAVVTTSSELCTPEMAETIEDAFGVRPLDLYASTEGLWGAACGEGGGHHVFEDLAIVENVDEGGRPVPDGERGARVLVTNLGNLVQPLIRFEVSDVVTIDPEPCPRGRTLRRMRSVEGRADAVLRLPGAAGERIPVHPLQFGVITADRGVREFQVLQRGDGVRVRVVAREGQPPAELAERLRGRVSDRLAALGVRDPHVEVEACAALERPPAGKLQLVVAESEVTAPA